ncbi:TetR/AcrR family transcriptional regulator [uncultured Finegoldia sp.]|uniref:TetR/AcrR family transcriptional regulator n=1 Tax=uncultured Finegoldia sp. TaxID=328009 RepID=UPI0026238DEB|nr:TetR/AcrR family transcriptional regulator [uncultured Finegoldia sp.]
MVRNKRMSYEQRKEEIKKVAAKVFVELGFSNTTMEDLVRETGLSKGGFYHYYKNTTDIIYDLMVDGINYRNEIIKKSLDAEKKLSIEFLAREMTKKVIDDTTLTGVYVEFLLTKKRNKKLEEIYKILVRKTIEAFKSINIDFKEYSIAAEKFEILTFFINSTILSSNILQSRQLLLKKKDLIEKMFLLILKEG